MSFQAYRSVHAPITNPNKLTSSRTVLRFILKHPQYRVPCAPIRSDFSRAFEDVKQAQEKGFSAAVLVVEGER